MLKNINKKLFVTSAKKACCCLLTTGIIIQTGILPVYEASANQAFTDTGSMLAQISETDLQALNTRITNLEAPTQAEAADILINEHETTLNVNDTFQLQLTDKDNNKINNVDWFVKVRAPYDVLYTADSYILQDGACTLSNDGLITAKAEGITEVWAKYNDALYRCSRNQNIVFDYLFISSHKPV